MIKFSNIKKSYDNFELHIPQLILYSNKIYALLGPNGSGKTTTIRILLGLLKPDSGNILIENSDIINNINIKKKIGYVPDNPNLYEDLTATEYLIFISNLYKCTDNETRKYMDELLERFELYTASNELISTYSKGMKQKVSIIAALIHKPNILILDEPFTGLDPIVIKTLKEYLKEYTKEGNIVIFSTHDLDVANNVCTDAVIMQKGKILSTFNNRDIREYGLENIFFKEMAKQKG